MYSIMFNEILPAPPPPPPPQDESLGPRFPVYLLPSLTMPFRRRRQSSHLNSGRPNETIPSLSSTPTDSTTSSPVESPTTPSFFLPMNLFKQKDSRKRSSLEPLETTKISRTQPNTIRCSTCASDFAFASQIVSKGFTGRYGRAFLVSPPDQPSRKGTKGRDLINIKVGKSETRVLVTGSHVVADIVCAVCHTKIGWKYIDAKEESQKYKVGKFILETQRVVVYRNWEDIMVDEISDIGMEQQELQTGDDDEPVIFDSDDEDECEDLFQGSWDAEVVAKRRSRKVNRRQKKSTD
ncbi:yippee-domain-containing protein [Annulohypoxylon maeteangense]|uniref:yippee-domain-containing protein n=1 Tax=Annulohypoxylon maeteangense TaxID=1927788 RepID=UPI0020072DA7|nr:yippee-domain-containing protein [Annulohypoxylon maeteangense]KAI0881750.1 yippee-domain-containing protein [Annulohypoxylon maeteangense]